MEQKKCKNKKCQRPLPEGYKHKYCENCRNEQAKQVKEVGKAALSLAVLIGGPVVTVATKGRINPNKK